MDWNDNEFEFAEIVTEFENNPDIELNDHQLHDVNLDVDEQLVESDYAEEMDDYMPENATASGGEGVHLNSDIEWSDAEFSSDCDSDQDVSDRVLKKIRRCSFNPETDMENPQFLLGMVVPSADDFKKAIREYAIINHRPIRFARNESRRVRAVCKEGCPWVIFASSISDNKEDKSLVIKTFNNEHTCTRVFEKKWISSSWLANKLLNKWIDDPNWKMNSFLNEVRRRTGVQVSPWTYYRTRKKCMIKIQGTMDEQYEKLWDYCDALKESNLGSTVKLKVSTNTQYPTFQRIYICFAACKRGWIAGCRRLIGLDGCHIKGPYTGQLLVAIGIDGDNSMFPIAYAIVESECSETWLWFLDLLTDDLEIGNSHTVTWITDKQKGLVDSVHTTFPNSEHRHCVRHLYNNFKVQHKGLQLKQILWNAARATTRNRFEQEMEKLKLIDIEAYQWLAEKDPKHWSRAFFAFDTSCDMLLNNLCEVFNAAILEARDKPIITCIDIIRRYISKRLVAKKELGEKWIHDVGPRVMKILEKSKLESIHCLPEYCGDDKFEVRVYYVDQFRVDLKKKTCDCNRWQLTGLPCSHAIACIHSRDLQLFDFVDECYKNTFLKAYGETLKPMPWPNLWKKTNSVPPKPPIARRQPGRPKKSRRKEPEEVTVSGTKTKKLKKTYIRMKCRTCGGKGHNSVGCPNKTGSQGVSQPRSQSMPPSQTNIDQGAIKKWSSTRNASKTCSKSKDKGKKVAFAG